MEIVNRQANFNYFIIEKYECGIVLTGTEIKSIRAGKANLKDAWCDIENGIPVIKQLHISPYEQGNRFNTDETRERLLLLHKQEINKIKNKLMQDGLTLIPLRLYLSRGRCKVEIALAKGKKNYDKRAVSAEKSANRQIERAMKEMNS